MTIDRYILKFCGLFDFNQSQIKKLTSTGLLEQKKILKEENPANWEYLHDQYYPFFRRFITNEGSDVILTNTNEFPKRKYYKIISLGKTEVEVCFFIKHVEIFIFKESPGIITLDIEIDHSNLDLEIFGSFVNATRNYKSVVLEGLKRNPISILNIIQDHILNEASEEGCFDLARNSILSDFRGSKLKVFQCVNLNDSNEKDLHRILFELGTVSPISTQDSQNDFNTHSDSYYTEMLKDEINVYKNWTALCLLDTFTVVGKNYLTQGMKINTWSENYFKIYVYNLYLKYYLFSVNGEGLHKKNRLGHQRREFYEFMRIYDNNHISYNFLPNLIHLHIRKGLDTATETEALRSKIDRITAIIQEDYSKLTNWILFVLAVVALFPSNWNDIVTSMKMDELNSRSYYSPNIMIYTGKVLIIVIIVLYNLVRSRWVRKLYAKSNR